MIRRHKRYHPIESESSEDDISHNRRLEPSRRCREVSNIKYNTRSHRKVPIIPSEESSSSETEEIIHSPRHGAMRALSDYDTCNTNDTEEEDLTHDINEGSSNETDSSTSDDAIQTRSGKRCRRLESSSSSDSGVPIGLQKRKKRIKLSSRNSSEDFSNEEPTVRLDLGLNNREGFHERQNRPNSSRNGSSLTINHNRSGSRNNMTQISLIINGGWSMSVGNMEDDNWSVRVSQINNDPDSSDDDIRPRVLRNHSRRVFQSNSSSSSDSDDEIPVRRTRTRRVVKPIIESENENKSGNELLSESDDAAEVCPICLNRFNSQVIGKPSNCDHCFCLTCIKEWATNNNTCPVDRQEFTTIRVHTTINSNFVEEIPIFHTQQLDDWGDDFSEGEINDDSIGYLSDDNIDYSDDDNIDYGEAEGDSCCVCYSEGLIDEMIECDCCSDVYHLACLDPPLEDLPAGAWLCMSCEGDDVI